MNRVPIALTRSQHRTADEHTPERSREAWRMWVDFQSARRFQPVRSEAGLNAPRRLKACPTTHPRPSLFSSLGVNGPPVLERLALTAFGPVPGRENYIK
jgi:hypothetical protein